MGAALLLAFLPSAFISGTLVLLVGSNGDPGWLSYIQSGGVIGMFCVLAWALASRKIVMGWTYDKMESERDFYRNISYKTTEIADRQVQAAEEMLRRMEILNSRSTVMDAKSRLRELEDKARE